MTTVLKVTEKAWQQTVVDYAQVMGWRVYHTFDSRRSAEGFPDLVMVRRGRVVVAELKAENGRVSTAQAEWLADLAEALPGCVTVWRPSDWPEVERALR